MGNGIGSRLRESQRNTAVNISFLDPVITCEIKVKLYAVIEHILKGLPSVA